MKKGQAQTIAMNNGGHASKLTQPASEGLSELMERLYHEQLQILQAEGKTAKAMRARRTKQAKTAGKWQVSHPVAMDYLQGHVSKLVHTAPPSWPAHAKSGGEVVSESAHIESHSGLHSIQGKAKSKGAIAIIATLDTKGPECLFVKEVMQKGGFDTVVIDGGILGTPYFAADFTREMVAEAGGTSMEEVLQIASELGKEGELLFRMGGGAANIIKKLYAENKIDGAFSMGGGMGGSIGAAALRALPVGVPKIIISSFIITGGAGFYAGTRDVTLQPSVVDLTGLNLITRKVLANGAGSVMGMVEVVNRRKEEESKIESRPAAIYTMTGVSTRGCTMVKDYSESQGFEPITFHAVGVGGRSLEELVTESENIGIVVDFSLNEVNACVHGGSHNVGEEGNKRLRGAGSKGTPQIICCGDVDWLNFGTADKIPQALIDAGRKFHPHQPTANIMRMNGAEMRQTAKEICTRLSEAVGPVTVMLPLDGTSELSGPGGPFRDKEADREFIEEMLNSLPSNVKLIQVDASLNDKAFADAVCAEFDRMTGIEEVSFELEQAVNE